MHPKRYSGDSFCNKKTVYDDAVIDYDFDFIIPGDKILQIVAFDWVPVQFRTLRLSVKVEPAGNPEQEKRIDFDFQRNEYRAKGDHFREPKKKEHKDGAER